MSYAAAVALQGAIYQRLRADPGVDAVIGDAIYDAMPPKAPDGPYVALGPEVARPAGSIGSRASEHDVVVSVVSADSDDSTGFAVVKRAAGAVIDALEGAPLALDTGNLRGLWLMRSTAKRADTGSGRRVDLTFRAYVDLD